MSIDHQLYADRLRSAYAGPTIAPIRHAEPDATIDDAYRIQAMNRDHWLRDGRRIVGAKIGLTSKAVQKQLGVDQPDSGVLFADMAISEGEPAPTGRLLQPKVEAEIAFCLGRDIANLPDDPSALVNAIAFASPALEIVDSRIADWDIKMVDTIADNASSGLFVLGGARVDVRGLDLTTCTMRMDRNGLVASEGRGAACLGNPLNALAWLAAMRLRDGDPLVAGDIILSGALGPMVPALPSDRFTAEIEGVGRVAIDFAA